MVQKYPPSPVLYTQGRFLFGFEHVAVFVAAVGTPTIPHDPTSTDTTLQGGYAFSVSG